MSHYPVWFSYLDVWIFPLISPACTLSTLLLNPVHLYSSHLNHTHHLLVLEDHSKVILDLIGFLFGWIILTLCFFGCLFLHASNILFCLCRICALGPSYETSFHVRSSCWGVNLLLHCGCITIYYLHYFYLSTCIYISYYLFYLIICRLAVIICLLHF